MALDIVESNQEAGLIASARKQEDAGNWLVQIPISAFPNSLHIAAEMAPPTMMAAHACPRAHPTQQTQQTQQTPVMDHPRPQGSPASPERTQHHIKTFLIYVETRTLYLREEGSKVTIAIAAYMHTFLNDCKLDEADFADEDYERVAVILTDIREYLDRDEDLMSEYLASKKDLDDVMVAFAEARRRSRTSSCKPCGGLNE